MEPASLPGYLTLVSEVGPGRPGFESSYCGQLPCPVTPQPPWLCPALPILGGATYGGDICLGMPARGRGQKSGNLLAPC